MKELVLDPASTVLYDIHSNFSNFEENLDAIRELIKSIEETKKNTQQSVITIRKTGESLYQLGQYAKYPVLTELTPEKMVLKVDDHIYKEDKDEILFVRFQKHQSMAYIKNKNTNKTFTIDNHYTDRLNIFSNGSGYIVNIDSEATDLTNYRNSNDKISNKVSNNEKDGVVQSIRRTIKHGKEIFAIELKNCPFSNITLCDENVLSINVKPTSLIFLKKYISTDHLAHYKEIFENNFCPNLDKFKPFLEDLKNSYEIELLSKDNSNIKYRDLDEVIEGCHKKIKEDYSKLFLFPNELESYYHDLRKEITFKQDFTSVKGTLGTLGTQKLVFHSLESMDENNLSFESLQPNKLEKMFDFIEKTFHDRKVSNKIKTHKNKL